MTALQTLENKADIAETAEKGAYTLASFTLLYAGLSLVGHTDYTPSIAMNSGKLSAVTNFIANINDAVASITPMNEPGAVLGAFVSLGIAVCAGIYGLTRARKARALHNQAKVLSQSGNDLTP